MEKKKPSANTLLQRNRITSEMSCLSCNCHQSGLISVPEPWTGMSKWDSSSKQLVQGRLITILFFNSVSRWNLRWGNTIHQCTRNDDVTSPALLQLQQKTAPERGFISNILWVEKKKNLLSVWCRRWLFFQSGQKLSRRNGLDRLLKKPVS